jgi:endoglucanase
MPHVMVDIQGVPCDAARMQKITSMSANRLPRWRGFNLLEMFSTARVPKTGPSCGVCPSFLESDFQWISDWGFDFVRLPMSYRCWSSSDDWLKIDEEVLSGIDEAIDMGKRYGIHVCLNLHRAPGYCVNPPPEPRNLWRDVDALAACCHHWRILARRYRDRPSAKVSFDLLNEPPSISEAMTRAEHERVIRSLVAAIREESPDRLIIADGLNYGNEPLPELTDLGIAQSCRAYLPLGVSHYKASWVGGDKFPPPSWPGGEHFGVAWDRAMLESHYAKWAQLMAQGIGVHCGEGGCYKETPHDVFLTWFRDVLEVLASHAIGYALWSFRGSFGVLDSGRADVSYKDWHGHSLDERLLELLRTH